MPASPARAILLCITAGLLAGARPVNAQLPVSGDWIRLQTSGGTVVGRVERIDGDSVVIERDGSGPRLAVARSQVSQLWVSTGESRNTWRGMRAGALSLGILGALLGFAVGDAECQGFMCYTPAESALVLGGGGVVTGAAAGALIGSFTRHHDWGAVELASVTVTPRAEGGVALSLQLRF